MNNEFTRTASIEVGFSMNEIYPLLCPKMEEKWIPGWKCEVLHSQSGFNEPGAVFKTLQPFGTELIWYTHVYDINQGHVEFTLFSPNTIVFNFKIRVQPVNKDKSLLTFTHHFLSIGPEGNNLIETYRNEDFPARLNDLGRLMTIYLKRKNR
jgi:hypothetical protein